MRDACAKYGTSVWAYALMDNHVHHVAVPLREDSLHKTIKVAHGDYASYLNQKPLLTNSSHGLCAILLAAAEMEAQ